MKKIFWFDVETTGLDPNQHDVIQLAYAVEVGGAIREEGNIFLQPFNYESVTPEALSVHGITMERLKMFQPPGAAYRRLIEILGGHVDKYDRSDKFQPAGYNTRFDLDFLKQFFVKNGDQYFGSFFNYKTIDPLAALYFLDGVGQIALPDYKLQTVCEHFNIAIKAHDAQSDIRATRELVKRLYSKMNLNSKPVSDG
jgi:DNA polymerase III alpha subunit (gram-positive type)